MTSPIETNNVVERLLRRQDGFPQTGRGTIDATGKGTVIMDPAPQVLVNPDGQAAADLIQSLSDRIDVLREAVDQYQNAPYRSADWLANEVMTILGVVANDAHPLTQGGKNVS